MSQATYGSAKAPAVPARGTFVSLEGIDGSGKSTQAALLARLMEGVGLEVVSLREPGGTQVSEKVRSILLDPANDMMADECELLLYEASRAQLVRQVIVPALARGAVVLCDRYYDSTYAYQHGGRGLDESLVRRCNELGSCGLSPDLTLLLDIDPALGFERATRGDVDRMEEAGLAFQRRTRDAYLRLATEEPARVRVIDARGSQREVLGRLVGELVALLPALSGRDLEDLNVPLPKGGE